MSYQLYWGDLHSHCSISYGHGTARQALLRARQQLDFCSVTGHAFWPDMPTDRANYAEIIDYHKVGFARLARNWQSLLAQQQAAAVDNTFVTFPSYEWHSLASGDHNVYGPGPKLDLRDAPDIAELRRQSADQQAIAIPHHIGYASGYRGINWDHFRADVSPFVEIFSLHGCSISDNAAYPMLHDMGPRDAGSTAEAGWARGHRFGVIASTDHHGAYPGSHGDGRMGVFAESLTRESLWDAFLARRVFAATGDRIDARLFVDDAWIGSVIRSNRTRHLRIDVRGSDAIQLVELIKNGRVIGRYFPRLMDPQPPAGVFRLRLTWGWGRKDKLVQWKGQLQVSDGMIRQVESCFSGQPIVAPKSQTGDEEIPDDVDLPHAILSQDEKNVAWQSVTKGNPTMRHATTQSISFEIDARPTTRVVVEVNGQRFEHSLAELMHGGRAHYMQGWLSEAIRIGPAVPQNDCTVQAELIDDPEEPTDIYRLQVAQRNGQWAWLSPIWVEQ